MVQKDDRFKNMDRKAATVISTVTGVEIENKIEEDKVDMCQALREMLEDSVQDERVVEREVLGAIRVMGPCMMMGQAAGTAAAMAVRNDEACFMNVSVEELRKQLWEDGVLNPEELPFD